MKNKSINDALLNFQLEQTSKDYTGGSQSPEEGVPVLKIGLNDPDKKSIVISQSDFCKCDEMKPPKKRKKKVRNAKNSQQRAQMKNSDMGATGIINEVDAENH